MVALMGVSGDGAARGIAKMNATLLALADGSFKRHLIERLAPEAAKLAARSIETSTNPVTGNRWRKLKHSRPRKRPGKGGPLFNMGALRDELAAAPLITSDGWLIATGRPGAAAHQYGYAPGHLPRRQFMPERKLPSEWQRRFNRVASDLFRGVYL